MERKLRRNSQCHEIFGAEQSAPLSVQLRRQTDCQIQFVNTALIVQCIRRWFQPPQGKKRRVLRI